MRDHRKLKAFQLADELALAVYRETAGFPPEELNGMTSQMRRTAVSVPATIVEGCGNPSDSEYLRLLDVASATVQQVEYQISLAQRLGYFETEEPDCRLLASETHRTLTKLTRWVQERLRTTKRRD